MPDAERKADTLFEVILSIRPINILILSAIVSALGGVITLYVTEKLPSLAPIAPVKPIDFSGLEEEISKKLLIKVDEREKKVRALKKTLELQENEIKKRINELKTLIASVESLSGKEKENFQFQRLDAQIKNLSGEVGQLSEKMGQTTSSIGDFKRTIEDHRDFIENLKNEILTDPTKILRVKNLSSEINVVNERLKGLKDIVGTFDESRRENFTTLLLVFSIVTPLFLGGGLFMVNLLLRRLREVELAVQGGQPHEPPPPTTGQASR